MNAAQPVRRRRLHYFSGFDPRGPAHYHRLCREEASRPQPQGATLSVGRREKLNPLDSQWTVQWQGLHEGQAVQVETQHVFMGWDDRIRAHWSRGPLALAADFVRTYTGIVRGVGPMRARALSRTAFLTGILPVVYLVLTALLGGLAGWATAALIGSAVAGGLVALAITGGLWAFGARQGLFWLLRIFHFIIAMGRAPLPDMQARAQEWAETIIALQAADPVDEVLLVGHSVGTLVMIDAVDRLLADPRWQALQGSRRTHLITLGQCLPFVGLVPTATAMRQALLRLCSHPQLLWWDVTARIDPLCFYATHPLAGSGLPTATLGQPVLHHPRFFQMYEPGRWTRIRRDKLLTHFLYLMTPDRTGNFQPFDVFYGPRSLPQQVARKGAA